MRDVSNKANTLRTASAEARLRCAASTIAAIRSGHLPKADPLPVARVAGIQAAKNTSQLIPYCHQVPLDFVAVEITLEAESIHVVSSVKAVWKTGVEMEALAAASAAALTLYDMLKIIDESMEIVNVRLTEKRGGKSDYKIKPDRKSRAGVLVLSDAASQGTREDTSGKAIRERLESLGVEVAGFVILPDDQEKITQQLRAWADKDKLDLVLTTGGTGLGPRDATPEATRSVIERELPGVVETLRAHGQERTRRAMLSRAVAGVRGKTVIVNLPGSRNAVNESMDVLLPWLLHAREMLEGGGH
ncbi:MAG: bifunctional molybdenum cofactor biosynthesis protein MoaC/MoaB [Bacteroidota bacterium]